MVQVKQRSANMVHTWYRASKQRSGGATKSEGQGAVTRVELAVLFVGQSSGLLQGDLSRRSPPSADCLC